MALVSTALLQPSTALDLLSNREGLKLLVLNSLLLAPKPGIVVCLAE